MSDLGDDAPNGLPELRDAVGPVGDGFTATDVVFRARQRERRRAAFQAGGAVAAVFLLLGGAVWLLSTGNDSGDVAAGTSAPGLAPTSASETSVGDETTSVPTTFPPTTVPPAGLECSRRVAAVEGCELLGMEVTGEPMSLADATNLAAQHGGELIAMRTAQLFCVQVNEPILGRPAGEFELTDFAYSDAATVYDRRARLGPPVTVGGGNPWEVDLQMWEFAQGSGVGLVALALYLPVDADVAASDRVDRVAPVDWIRSEVVEGDSETEGEIFLRGDLSEFGELTAQSGCTAEGPLPGDLVGTPDPNPTLPFSRCATEATRDLEVLEPYFAVGELTIDIDGDGQPDDILVSPFSRDEQRVLSVSLSSQQGAVPISDLPLTSLTLELPPLIDGSSFSLLGSVDTDEVPGADYILLDEGGNTAKSGVVLSIVGCDIAVVEDIDGGVFSYLHDGSGNSCLPGGCPVSVVCAVEDSQTLLLELGVGGPTDEARRLAMEDESGEGPAWADPMMEWSRNVWSIEGTTATELEEGASTRTGTLQELGAEVTDGVVCQDQNVVESSDGPTTATTSPAPPATDSPNTTAGAPDVLAPDRGAGPITTIPGQPRPLVIESRPITAAESARVETVPSIMCGNLAYMGQRLSTASQASAPEALQRLIEENEAAAGLEAQSDWIELVDGSSRSIFVHGNPNWNALVVVEGSGAGWSASSYQVCGGLLVDE